MSEDFSNLLQQCRRFGVEYGFAPERCALELLAKLNPKPGTVLNWITVREWQLEQDKRVVISGSLEDCVVELARRCEP
jgi:hypothetical protein